MSNTHQLLGAVKKIRAIKDLVYQGKAIRGRKRTRTDGKHGSYEVHVTDGEIIEVDQDFAREVIQSGAAEYLSGGLCTTVEETDAIRLIAWSCQTGDPLFERCETLGPISFADLIIPAGLTIRVDINQFDRPYYCYEDETFGYSHRLRVLKPSPKRLRISAAEQSSMVSKLMAAVFPAAALHL